ncbi:MAG TPA: FAD-dependent monooxygenase [Steroidobacteraceae bacterium]|nr:FAD-dependent monooxygenase [Steroidobacteraceae bacterium]
MTDEAPVLIAGGGLTGLAAAAFLAQQGVRSIAVERLKQSSPLPRAAFFHMRTLEMFRGLGIEARVREESAKEFVPDGALIAMDCISGRKLADIIANLNEGVDAVSPCRRWFLNQPSLEPILRERAREAGATVLQGTEIVSVRQDAGGVTLGVQDVGGGNERELAGRYLIAADGGHSKVRELLGIGYEGRGTFSRSLTIYFTADLSPWLGEKPWSIIYVNNAQFAGFFRMNRSGRVGFLGVNTVGDPKVDPAAAMNAAADISQARMIELVRIGVGKPDLEVHIDGFSRWRATAEVAQRFSEGRIFVIGDAAHLMPPNGGFGGNTGIHDAHNLAWKLAQVIQGHAHPRLLDSYAGERKPVARFTVEQAFSRYVARTAPWLAATQQTEPVAHDFDIEIGYLYGRQEVHADPRTTRGLPGSRLPHYWLERDGQRVSTIDLTGRWLLLAGSQGAAWPAAARQAADAAGGMAIDAWRVGAELRDTNGGFEHSVGIGPDGALLVRPDGFVAWRAEQAVADAATALRAALGTALGR